MAMTPSRILQTCTLALATLGLGAQDAESRDRHTYLPWNYGFGAEVLATANQGDLRQAMGDRTGFGIGAQWTDFDRDWWLDRTRLEWNVFPESLPLGPGGMRTRMKNITLSWDQLVFFAREPIGPYVLGGIGAIRWFREATPTLPGRGETRSWNATKLGVTVGLGLRLANQVSLEGRYIVSSLDRNMDSRTAQLCLGWHF
jgi:hypothetical protein